MPGFKEVLSRNKSSLPEIFAEECIQTDWIAESSQLVWCQTFNKISGSQIWGLAVATLWPAGRCNGRVLRLDICSGVCWSARYICDLTAGLCSCLFHVCGRAWPSFGSSYAMCLCWHGFCSRHVMHFPVCFMQPIKQYCILPGLCYYVTTLHYRNLLFLHCGQAGIWAGVNKLPGWVPT